MNAAEVWVLSHGIGGFAFACLTILLVVSARFRSGGGLLILACAANTVWCSTLALAPVFGIGGSALDVIEVLRDGAWLVFVAWLLPTPRSRHGAVALRGSAVALPVALASFLILRLWWLAGSEAEVQRSVFFVVGAVGISVWGLILLEQIYRAAGNDQRWGLKYLCLGIAALFGYDFLMYSYAQIYQRIDITIWDARGAMNALVAPLIAVSVARRQIWAPRLRLSQQAAFHTGAIIASGAYLLFMVLAGYYIRDFGGTWSTFVGVFFLVAMTLLLLVVVLSGQMRARAKVLIKKHFFSYKYDYRAEWLGLTQRLTHAGDAADPYQRSIRAVAHILESPAGALWLSREGAYVCVSTWNMAAAADVVEASNTSFMNFLRNNHWIVDMDQYHRDPSHYAGMTPPDWLSDIPRARLFIPLFFEHELLGFMLLAVPRAHYALTWEDLDLLKTLGTQVGGFLGQQESNQALAQARQFEAFNRLTAFLMHDLKNIAAQQSLIVQNAQRHKDNPEFVDDMIMTVDSSVERMTRLLEQLQRTTSQKDNERRVEVGAILRQAVAALGASLPKPRLDTASAEAFVRVDPERFVMILRHVIRNAQEATPPEGNVSVQMREVTSSVRIAVIDDGAGMAAAFVRESLFKPFYTTKSTRGMGIGAYQAREFARASGGDVEVVSAPGEGTTFTIVLPAAATTAIDATGITATAVSSS